MFLCFEDAAATSDIYCVALGYVASALTEKEHSGKVLSMKLEVKQRIPHLIKNSTSELNKKIAYVIMLGVICSCIETYLATKLSFLIFTYLFLMVSYELISILPSLLNEDSFLYTDYTLFIKNLIVVISFLPFVLISASGYATITGVFIFNLFFAVFKIVILGCSTQRH